jgi:alpha-D-xyloside xylohydrolase
MRLTTFVLIAAAASACLKAQWLPLNPVTAVQRQNDGLVLTLQTGVLRLQVCTDSIIHVQYTPTSTFPKLTEYVVTKTEWPAPAWEMQSAGSTLTLSTARMSATVSKEEGTILFKDKAGHELLADGPRQMIPAEVNGEKTYHSDVVFKMYGSEEGLYGLGQHQAGVWNFRGESIELSQENANIAVPMWVSSKGYGVFWNNPGISHFNNRFVHYLYVGSTVADTIDYYFFYGPEMDKIVADYRELTGTAPMFGKWAYGFWQCKNKYTSQKEILDVAHKYRDLHIPMDNIVQDWFWWTNTGEFKFNKNYPDPKGMIDDLHKNNVHIMFSVWPYFYPGSATYDEMDKLGYFVDRTVVKSFHPKGMALYDAYNPAARKYYWKLIDDSLFKIGADAWWMDTTEPESEGVEEPYMMHDKVGGMSGARYADIFPLLTTTAVHDGQRAASDQKRVYILSRSAFAGSQRNGVTAWSGDVLSDFETYKRQIPAALNFELSGIPYWTSDIGGFIMGHPNDPAYRELFVRWFQFGTFCPILRVHGTRAPDTNELWSYGPQAQAALVRFDKLRYRLMPYIYSTAWMVTNAHYTPMRPLVMDFAADERVQNVGDQFLFGPSILVNPVTEQGATSRRLYLPAGTRWYDFWSGEAQAGGKVVEGAAPLDRIPLYVRAGSIVPLGPDVEYAAEKAADPIELRVFAGADGDFTIYEDENDNYNYEHGVYATIPLHWDDAGKTLTIGARKGTFPGMLTARTFRIVFVGAGHGVGGELTGVADKTVNYAGAEVKVGR